MKIAVAGGTGVVGSHVVTALLAAGHEPVVLARSTGVDLLTGDGLADRLGDVGAVIDVTGPSSSSKGRATRFFTTTTANLLRAEQTAGVRHRVLLSIVGIDVTPFGYYQAKVAQEEAVRAGHVDWTIVRAPQFHEFAAQLVDRAGLGPVVAVPRMRSAPMAAAEVGEVLADLAAGEPRGRTGDLAGPEVAEMPDLVRRLLEHRGSRRKVVPLKIPGEAGRRMSSGALVAADPWITGTQGFDQWLEEQP